MPLFNYSKPGPGVSKDAPPKKRIVLYFELLGRKFFPLLRLNLLFLIPVIIAAALVFLIGTTGVVLYVACIPLILLAPFLGGLTYVTRNYTREEHAFILSDFWDTAKSNWKQLMIHCIITYLFIVIMDISIRFYSLQAITQGRPFFYIPLVICLIFCIVFLFMQYYIPLMIITLELNLKAIYKNAWILSLAGFKQNFLVTLVLLLFFVLMVFLCVLSIPTMLIALLLCVLILFSFISFTINFAVYPNIEKYLIKPYYQKQEENEEGEDQAEEESLSKKQSEYVYENGKLIKKSLLEQEALFEDSSSAKKKEEH